MARFLITYGIVMVVAGALWPIVSKLGLDRLPGDIVIEGEHFRLYIPLGTSILISLVLTAARWLFDRWR